MPTARFAPNMVFRIPTFIDDGGVLRDGPPIEGSGPLSMLEGTDLHAQLFAKLAELQSQLDAEPLPAPNRARRRATKAKP